MSGATRTTTDTFLIDIPQQSLDDIHDRLTRGAPGQRSPGPNPEDYGVSLAWVREPSSAQWNMHPEPGGQYAAHLEPDVPANDIRGFYRRYQ